MWTFFLLLATRGFPYLQDAPEKKNMSENVRRIQMLGLKNKLTQMSAVTWWQGQQGCQRQQEEKGHKVHCRNFGTLYSVLVQVCLKILSLFRYPINLFTSQTASESKMWNIFKIGIIFLYLPSLYEP